MPLRVLAAVAAGLPVPATAVGDGSAMRAAENRFCVTARDDAALAAGLTALVTQPALRRAIGAANRSRAEQEYGQEAMFAAYADLFGAGRVVTDQLRRL